MDRANFFADGSPFLHHPLLTTARTAAEIDFLLTQFDLGASSRVLDVGCGFGRHTIELVRRGYTAVGIDPSAAMIAAAKERPAPVEAKFLCADGETFVDAQPFGAAICLFTSLGQMTDDDDNRGLVKNVFNLLQRGGYFAVEVPQREVTVRMLKHAERFGGDDAYTEVTRAYDAANHVVTEHFHVASPQENRDFILRYRLFSGIELVALLQDAGFEITARFADYQGNALNEQSPTMLLIGHKP